MKEFTFTPTAFHLTVPVLPELGANLGVLESALEVILAKIYKIQKKFKQNFQKSSKKFTKFSKNTKSFLIEGALKLFCVKIINNLNYSEE